jgi:hypothetical protein
LVIIAALFQCGCESAANPVPPPAPAELSLEEQVRAVEAGKTTRIQIEATPFSQLDLPLLQDLDPLTELLLDHPDSKIHAGWFLVRLPNLTHFRYRGTGIDDLALTIIVFGSPKLQILNIPRGEFTDSGLEELKSLPDLVQLRFGSPHVTDEGMKTIAELPALKRLHLIGVSITDAGLAELAKIERLESLYVDDAKISDAAWEELFRQRPKLHVHINQQHHDRDPHQHEH